MNLPDFTNYTDEKLDAARVAILTEQERRANLAAIPGQMQQLAQQYVDGGGDLADLSLDPPAPIDAPADLTDQPEE